MSRMYTSASQIDAFSKCPRKWHYQYVEKKPQVWGIQLLAGDAMAAGVNAFWKERMTTRTELDPSQVIEAAIAGWHSSLTRTVEQGKTFETHSPKEASDLQLTAAGAAVALIETWAKGVTPVRIEEKVLIKLPGVDVELLGYLDVVLEDASVWDIKFKAKAPKKTLAHNSKQLTVYALALREKYGETPPELGLACGVGTKTPYARILPTRRDAENCAAMRDRIVEMELQIQSGLFPPADQEHDWWCTPKWCEYFAECPYGARARSSMAVDF